MGSEVAAPAVLYDHLAAFARQRTCAFHVPGHKQRAGWPDAAGAIAAFGPLLPFDVTELADTDDLHHPEGPIAEAQRHAADCFGAEETRFLVGGSTAGNMAMIVGLCGPGERVIVQRNVHKSIIHGLMLAEAEAVLLHAPADETNGLSVVPALSALREALETYPDVKAVILSNPNYYGMTADLTPYVEAAHACGVPVLVDEAHGAHFGFHPDFPQSALRAGADVVVQSAHKTLSALTMGAMLHMQGSLVDREAIRQALRMLQSSSPSFPILASLDLARAELHTGGAEAFAPAMEAVRTVRRRLEQTAFRAIETPAPGGIGGTQAAVAWRQDPLKLAVYDPLGRIGGFRLRDELAARGCLAEMADDRHALLAFGTGSRPEDGAALAIALQELDARLGDAAPPSAQRAMPPAANSAAAPVRFSRRRVPTADVPFDSAAGHQAGEWIIPYPPGIPELYPGERITAVHLERLTRWRAAGATVQGAANPELATIRVYAKGYED